MKLSAEELEMLCEAVHQWQPEMDEGWRAKADAMERLLARLRAELAKRRR